MLVCSVVQKHVAHAGTGEQTGTLSSWQRRTQKSARMFWENLHAGISTGAIPISDLFISFPPLTLQMTCEMKQQREGQEAGCKACKINIAKTEKNDALHRGSVIAF